MFKKTFFIMLALIFVLAACSPATTTPDEMVETQTTVTEDKMKPESD